MLAPNDLRSFRNVVIPSIAILLVLIIAAAAWTYTMRECVRHAQGGQPVRLDTF
jgi:hypothetical protein